jgi:uncharacterized damage-inducible protein DinB
MSPDTSPERVDPPLSADERATLLGFLDYHRATLLRKVDGLDAAQLDTTLPPSTMTLGGMVKHLAFVEHWWTRCVFEGGEYGEPWASVDWDADWDWDWHSAAGAEPAELLALLGVETAASDEVLRRASDLGQLSRRTGRGGQPFSLRWILVHLVEEYARHNGHADLIRESIDGAVGE